MSTVLLRRIAAQCQHRAHLSTKFGRRPRFSTTTSSLSNRPLTQRPFTVASIAVALSITAYTVGAIFPPTPISILSPRPAPAPPLDPTSPESIAYIESLEADLQSLPLLLNLRQDLDAIDWYETRPYQKYPEERRVNSLTAGTLRGPGKLALPPLVRVKKDESQSVVFVHLGRGLCGHDGIIHGGLLATLLDETLARTAISNLPDRVGVTANLLLNYRAPTRADQFVVIKTNLLEAKGRKATVSGCVENLEGAVLVEATATFVQPRYAKLINTAALKQAMGEPPSSDTPVHLADGEKLKPNKVHATDAHPSMDL